MEHLRNFNFVNEISLNFKKSNSVENKNLKEKDRFF